jgi:ABC-type branched-subunit amino acid transport system substrate-binding protein
VVLLALIASAGGGVATAAASSASEVSASGQPAGPPLKLMSVFEGTGPSASPEVPEGAIAAAKAINAHGGIKGRPVQVIPCDTQNDPNTAAACGRQAVAQGVVAMVGDLTDYGNEFMPLLAQHKIPSIGLEPSTSADFTSPSSFPIAGGAPVVLAGLAETLAEGGAKHIAMARVDIGPADALKGFSNNGLKRFHQMITRDVPVPPGAPDMSPYVANALKGGTDAIVVALPSQDAVNFVLAARQADPGIKIALIATELGDVLQQLKGDANGVMETASDTVALRNSAEKQYEKDMRAAGYHDFTGFRLASYTSVLVFQKIAENLPAITAPAVLEALNHAQNLQTGLTAPLQYTKGGVAGLPRVFNPCLFATKIAGGKQVPISGKFENAFTGKECPTPR